MSEEKNRLLRQVPKVDELLQRPEIAGLLDEYPRRVVLDAVRTMIDGLRRDILALKDDGDFIQKGEAILSNGQVQTKEKLLHCIRQNERRNLRSVINATGVILHTNLGRSRLGDQIVANIAELAGHYSNLEYDLEEGARGSRHSHLEEIVRRITGAEAVMAVNNNAAAVMLCLGALAKDGQTLVSRGELVEIGGSFRIPDIIEQSGSRIMEVGTTNKTRAADYETAILPEQTKAILKVHTSNYEIVGFTEQATLRELKEIAQKYNLPLIYDLGSGLMVDLRAYGITEPTVREALSEGADVVLFSGDKLLGGPQAGIIAGKKEYIEKMKKHPLARVVRMDKLTLAALEETFRCYLDEEQAMREIPVLAMITSGKEELQAKAKQLAEMIRGSAHGWEVEITEETSRIGGGSAPLVELPSFAVSIHAPGMSVDELERRFRSQEIPIIVRIAKDRVLIDVRTVRTSELEDILAAVAAIKLMI